MLRGSRRREESFTSFERIAYQNGESIVRCKPNTGRMHQIRVHLQYLGFPISNDPLYSGTQWGETRGRGGVKPEKLEGIVTDLIETLLPLENEFQNGEFIDSVLSADPNIPLTDAQNPISPEIRPFPKFPLCSECAFPPADPPPQYLCMWLHAYQYKGADWTYTTNLPEWASFADQKSSES
eukprot:Sdes_comp20668_c1_seq1m16013